MMLIWQLDQNEILYDSSDTACNQKLKPDVIFLYWVALQQIKEEGDPRAKLMSSKLTTFDITGVQWASYVHYHDWKSWTLNAKIKARMVRLRLE